MLRKCFFDSAENTWVYRCVWRLPSPNHLNMCQCFLMSVSLFGICKKECLKEAICQVLCRNVFCSPKTIKINWFYSVLRVPGRSSGAPWPFTSQPSGDAFVPTKPYGFCCVSFFQCQGFFTTQWTPGVILMLSVDRAWAWLRACSCPTPEMWFSPGKKTQLSGGEGFGCCVRFVSD